MISEILIEAINYYASVYHWQEYFDCGVVEAYEMQREPEKHFEDNDCAQHFLNFVKSGNK